MHVTIKVSPALAYGGTPVARKGGGGVCVWGGGPRSRPDLEPPLL